MGITEKKQKRVQEIQGKQPGVTQAEVQKVIAKEFGTKLAKTPLSAIWKGGTKRKKSATKKAVSPGVKKAIQSEVERALVLGELLARLKSYGVSAVVLTDGRKLPL